MGKAIQVAVDIGGTFTDLVALDIEQGTVQVAKVSSTPPNYSEGVTQAIRQIDEDFNNISIFIHGTTAPLNAFLQRKGVKTALITTSGFGDIYKMARGGRLRMYDLHYKNPEPLIPRHMIYEVEERIDAKGKVLQPLDVSGLDGIIAELKQKEFEAVAVCLINSYMNPEHEEQLSAYFAEKAPELFVSVSSHVCREWREYERTSTITMNAYISPILKNYLHKLKDSMSGNGYKKNIYLMQSNGGLITADEAESRGVQILMSGPVGGSVGSRSLSSLIGEENLICVDMGGTSFDFSLIINGKASLSTEKTLGELPLLAPMVDIQTIGAGGGSIAWNDSGALRVGPQSAGAVPGPACYGRGGTEPTVTDANIVLGRLDPERNLGGSLHLDKAKAIEAVGKLAAEFNLSTEKMAEGIIDVVNAQMANAIRSITISKGIDPRSFTLVAFGGAGPMHAVFLAEELEMHKIIVPEVAGAFSAWGMLNTDLRHDASQTYIVPLGSADWKDIESKFLKLGEELRGILSAEGVEAEDMSFTESLDMRYVGQEYFINVPLTSGFADLLEDTSSLKQSFDDLYFAQYGHKNLAEEVEIVNLRMEGHGALKKKIADTGKIKKYDETAGSGTIMAASDQEAIFKGQYEKTRFILRESLDKEQQYAGPMVIEEISCTTIVPPGYDITIDTYGNLMIQRRVD